MQVLDPDVPAAGGLQDRSVAGVDDHLVVVVFEADLGVPLGPVVDALYVVDPVAARAPELGGRFHHLGHRQRLEACLPFGNIGGLGHVAEGRPLFSIS